MRIGDVLTASVLVRSGVLQGCSLSPLLIALDSDVFIWRIASCLYGDEDVEAFADDTAVAVSNYIQSLSGLCTLFSEFEQISALALNI